MKLKNLIDFMMRLVRKPNVISDDEINRSRDDILLIRAISNGFPAIPKLHTKDRPWIEYPIGTRAYAIDGYWERVNSGWKRCIFGHGSVSQTVSKTPGAYARGRCIEFPRQQVTLKALEEAAMDGHDTVVRSVAIGCMTGLFCSIGYFMGYRAAKAKHTPPTKTKGTDNE